MPKIIPNLRETILTEGKKILLEKGYAAFTVRDVAAASGIGIGTVYNYFESKEYLSALIMLGDWKKTLADLKASVRPGMAPADRAGLLFAAVRSFREVYAPVWSRYAAGADIRVGMTKQRHALLVSQLADACGLDEFVTELLLHFASNTDTDFATIVKRIPALF